MYIILRGHWCNIIVLNVHASTEDKINHMNMYDIVIDFEVPMKQVKAD
jgi:hypothetical protein